MSASEARGAEEEDLGAVGPRFKQTSSRQQALALKERHLRQLMARQWYHRRKGPGRGIASPSRFRVVAGVCAGPCGL